MRKPQFIASATSVEWGGSGRTFNARIEDIAFTAHRPWYSGKWTVTGTSPLSLPVDVTAFVAKAGAAHGYWRNVRVHADYFSHCSIPALMQFLVGELTMRAMRAHDSGSTGHDVVDDGNSVELHIRNRTVETTSRADAGNTRVVALHIGIHQALAADHAEALAMWQRAADRLGGTVVSRWPPVLSVPRIFGSATITLNWPSATSSSTIATIEVTADARKAPLWTIERELSPAPNSRIIGDRPFFVLGEIPIADDLLARVVTRAEILSITVRRNISIRIAALMPDVEVLEEVLDLIALLCGPSDPYR